MTTVVPCLVFSDSAEEAMTPDAMRRMVKLDIEALETAHGRSA